MNDKKAYRPLGLEFYVRNICNSFYGAVCIYCTRCSSIQAEETTWGNVFNAINFYRCKTSIAAISDTVMISCDFSASFL